jgi:ketosteroid isomerase-like protein
MTNETKREPLPAGALQPGDCDRLLLDAFERGDIDATMALYEQGAVLLTEAGEAVTGHAAIRAHNAAIIGLKPRFTIDFIRTTLSGDGTLATTRMKCRLAGADPNGNRVEMSVHTLEVLRRQPDGTWKYVIDDPYGSMREGMKQAG